MSWREVTVDCYKCDGTGKIEHRASPDEECDNCHGWGKVRIRDHSISDPNEEPDQ